MKRLAVVVALALVVLTPPVARGQKPVSDSVLAARVREVSSELRCPVCQGLSLQDSPSELSQEMKDVVREQLAAGKSPEEVKQYFVSKYGEWILLEPEPTGFNVAVYLLPIGLFLVGGAVILLAVRKWTATGAEAGQVVAEED
jgi:cytochrome c-type biogenesis protein CcmH